MTRARREYLRRKRRRQQIKRRALAGAACLVVGLGAAGAAFMLHGIEGAPAETAAESEYTQQRASEAPPIAGVTAELSKAYQDTVTEAEAVTEQPEETPEPEEIKKLDPPAEEAKPKKVYTFTKTEETQLQKIGLAEMEVEGVEAMAHAMRVIINRVESDSFPDTIEGVIFQPKQFTPILNGSYYNMIPNKDSRKALEMVKAGWDETQGALYFEVTTDEPTWHSRSLKKLYEYKSTSFYTDK